MKFSLKQRLVAGFALVTVLLAMVAAAGLYGMHQLNRNIDQILDYNNPKMKLAGDLRASILDRSIAARNVAMFTDPREMGIEVERIRKQEREYQKSYAELGELLDSEQATSAEEKQLFANMKTLEAAVLPHFQRLIQLGLDNQVEEAARLIMHDLRPSQRAWIAGATALMAVETRINEEAGAAADVSNDAARNTILVLALVALAASVAVAFAIIRSILAQLGGDPTEAQLVARQIAAGNLAVPVVSQHGGDDSLMASLEAMRAQLNLMVVEIKESANLIASAAAEIADGNHDLSQRTEEQASSLEETASSMEEMTSTIRNNSDNAVQGRAVADSAATVAGTGLAVVDRVVDQVTQTMSSINESSRKIVDIISVIDGIAFQTNILALNAAVEAARAGEQGRGFAVVATEVRNLAQRSAAAAKEIKVLIEDSVDKVGSGTKLVEQAGATMSQVVTSVRQVTDIVAAISAATDEQNAGIAQVHQAITQMDQVTQENASLVEETAAAAQLMRDQAEELQQAVAAFKISAAQAPVQAAPRAKVAPIGAAVARAPKAPAAKRAAPAKLANAKPASAKPASDDWEEF